MNRGQLSTIVLRRRFFILGFSGAVIAATGLLALIAKPNYQSSMEMLVSYNLDEASNIQTNGENFPVIDYTAQKTLMLSSQLLQKAVDLLRPTYPQITLEDIKGEKLNVSQSKLQSGGSSQVFTISFKDHDPVKAKRVLQALQKVYQDYDIEQRRQRLNQGLDYVNNRLPKVQNQIKTAEEQLTQFRQKHHLLDPQIQSQILLESLTKIQSQQQTNYTELQQVQAQYNNLKQELVSPAENLPVSYLLSQSSRYQTLLSEIHKTELALAQEQLRYKDDYPTVKNLKQQRQVQLDLLQAEVGSKTISNVNTAAENQINQLQTTSMKLIADNRHLADSEAQIRSELNTYPSLIAEYNRLLSAVAERRQAFQQLLQMQQSVGMKIAEGGFDWQVLDAPNLGIYLSNSRLFLLLGGAIFSPILGTAVAITWELFHGAIFCAQDFPKLTQLRLLGSVPKFYQQPSKGVPLFPFFRSRFSSLPVHKTLDMVYQNIQILKYPCPLKSLMLTSALPGEGKTTIALGLGASAARMHQRVLVIDANLRHPSLHQVLGLSNDWGLSLLLLDEDNNQIHNYIHPIHPAIDILTAGPTAEDVVSLLSSPRFQEVLELCKQTYDLILVDTPGILNQVDGRIIASYCDGIVMVGGIGKISPDNLIQAKEILHQLNLVGIIANGVTNSPVFAKISGNWEFCP